MMFGDNTLRRTLEAPSGKMPINKIPDFLFGVADGLLYQARRGSVLFTYPVLHCDPRPSGIPQRPHGTYNWIEDLPRMLLGLRKPRFRTEV